ncbi:polyubiquitin [Biomphalaria pfeifferi]|uniref:Polyubiquitin n=1 Tax=Biomphalaria pfeifferi TaxID=112525 RepID=A0AAD8CCC5_BIOPF|nr:polyubiquitin [Biomphalaria pfeifferi]
MNSRISNRSSTVVKEVDKDDSSSQATLTITASVSESPRLSRRGPSNSASLTARPSDTPVTTTIVKNTNGELVNATSQASIYQAELNNSTSVLATITIGEANDQGGRPGGQCRPEIKPDEVQPFQIFVSNHLDNRTSTYYVKDTYLVEQLVKMIQEKLGIPPKQQRLVYAGQNLVCGMKLSHYDIRPNSTLYLTGRLRGGSCY